MAWKEAKKLVESNLIKTEADKIYVDMLRCEQGMSYEDISRNFKKFNVELSEKGLKVFTRDHYIGIKNLEEGSVNKSDYFYY